jgi:hypothetical protein
MIDHHPLPHSGTVIPAPPTAKNIDADGVKNERYRKLFFIRLIKEIEPKWKNEQ